MKFLLFITAVLALSHMTHAQKQAYVIYNAHGKSVKYEKMLRTLEKSDLILFGELHDNPISHWLQYEVTADLHGNRKLVLGAEMFEADNQTALSEYIDSTITYEELDSLARLWRNYETDYAPLVDFARTHKLPFIATNIPRRFANLVYREGFEALDSLSSEEKEWIAPLPVPFDSDLPTYQNILSMAGDHGTPELVKAQAMKDATMAHFILKNHHGDHLFIHYNGAYHSNHYEGILWYVQKDVSDINYATISTVSQENVNKLLEENHHIADFIICVDSNMTRTY